MAITFAEAAKLTDEEARTYLEEIRWPDGPICPHCEGFEKIYDLQGDSHRDGLYKCGDCRKQFTVTVGTVMHRTKIPLSKWVFAFHIMCASKKGVSALQLQRMLGLGSYRTAWHMAHRIRLAMREEPLAGMLAGDVEADETFVGGKTPRRQRPNPVRPGRKKKGPAADFQDRKTPVLVLVERNGRAVARKLERITADGLREAINDHVDKSRATLHTDERIQYRKIGPEFAGGHTTVNHSAGEYAAGNASCNTAESYFSLLKRSVMGAYHHVSDKHLGRYLDHQCFLWNTRGSLGRYAYSVRNPAKLRQAACVSNPSERVRRWHSPCHGSIFICYLTKAMRGTGRGGPLQRTLRPIDSQGRCVY